MNPQIAMDEATAHPLGTAAWLTAVSQYGRVGAQLAAGALEHSAPGPVDDWAPSLRMAVGSCLASGLPTIVAWGEELAAVYNDAFADAAGVGTESLGMPLADVAPRHLVPAEEVLLGVRQGAPMSALVATDDQAAPSLFLALLDEAARPAGVVVVMLSAEATSRSDQRIALLSELWRELDGRTSRSEIRELAAKLIALKASDFTAIALVDEVAPSAQVADGPETLITAPSAPEPIEVREDVDGAEVIRVRVPSQVSGEDAASHLVLEVTPQRPGEPAIADYALMLGVVLGAALDGVRSVAEPSEGEGDALWREAILKSFRDPILMFDGEGRVVELNQAFTDLFGYSLADGPIRPPYPWWPTMEEDPERHAESWTLFRQAMDAADVDAEVVFYTKDRRPLWIHTTGSAVSHPGSAAIARIRVLRDVTREREARARRATAAEVCAAFGQFDDLGSLLGCAEHAFGILFDGGSTIQVEVGERYLFADGRRIDVQDLGQEVSDGLAGSPNPDTSSLRPGILLVPGSTSAGARAWVQFPRPRRITADEMVAADLLAHAFGLAVDRLVDAQRAADKTANLEYAVESHRLIGQAVGILVERHRITPAKSFDLLRAASQARNLKLREVALRVIETGVDPDSA